MKPYPSPAADALIVSVPLVAKDTQAVSANISLQRGMLKAIDEAAKRRKLTRPVFLVQAAKSEIEK